MSVFGDAPRCPDCDGPISTTATYCMHCGVDFSEGDANTLLDSSAPPATQTVETSVSESTDESSANAFLDPDGLLDNSLTLVVGIVGGYFSDLRPSCSSFS